MSLNDGFTYGERVGRNAENEALLAYLCRRYRHSSPSDWLRRIESGDVRVDAEAALPHDRLRSGQSLEWHRPPWDEPDAPLAFFRLYEDDDVVAVAKPAGLPTLPGANFLQSTLLHQVRLEVPEAAPLHRLGRWTSGVVLFAKTRTARAELSRQLRAREIGKRYRALATGRPEWGVLTVDRPIGPVPHATLGSVHAASDDGKPSVSRIEVLERRGDSFLCDVRIETGRPHQIRIHLAAAGHPLVGDPLYVAFGIPAPDARALPGDPGYKLHAAEMSFLHPRTGRVVIVTAKAPDATFYAHDEADA
jgi:23S rRNA pseudouridine1911/1915/1917 synthase